MAHRGSRSLARTIVAMTITIVVAAATLAGASQPAAADPRIDEAIASAEATRQEHLAAAEAFEASVRAEIPELAESADPSASPEISSAVAETSSVLVAPRIFVTRTCDVILQDIERLLDAEDAVFELPSGLTRDALLERLEQQVEQLDAEYEANGCDNEVDEDDSQGQGCGIRMPTPPVAEACRLFLLSPPDFVTRLADLLAQAIVFVDAALCNDTTAGILYLARNMDPNALPPPAIPFAVVVRTIAIVIEPFEIAICGPGAPLP